MRKNQFFYDCIKITRFSSLFIYHCDLTERNHQFDAFSVEIIKKWNHDMFCYMSTVRFSNLQIIFFFSPKLVNRQDRKSKLFLSVYGFYVHFRFAVIFHWQFSALRIFFVKPQHSYIDFHHLTFFFSPKLVNRQDRKSKLFLGWSTAGIA